jgi:hypothetical protein
MPEEIRTALREHHQEEELEIDSEYLKRLGELFSKQFSVPAFRKVADGQEGVPGVELDDDEQVPRWLLSHPQVLLGVATPRRADAPSSDKTPRQSLAA